MDGERMRSVTSPARRDALRQEVSRVCAATGVSPRTALRELAEQTAAARRRASTHSERFVPRLIAEDIELALGQRIDEDEEV